MTTAKFSGLLISKMPNAMTMPPVLIEAMDWLEAQGGRQVEWQGAVLEFDRQSVALYPVEDWQNPGHSLACFAYYGPFSFAGVPPPVADEDERVFLFVRTGGDGSYAGFWLDEAGKQWVIHHGSGSGSDWWGVVSDDPTDLLRLLAIGYVEPAFREVHRLTVQEAAREMSGNDGVHELAHIMAEGTTEGAEDPDAFHQMKDALAEGIVRRIEQSGTVNNAQDSAVPPVAFQAYLKDRFGIDTPQKAYDFLPKLAGDCDEIEQDPFAQWLENTQPKPTAEDLAYIEELSQLAQDFVVDMDNDVGSEPKSSVLQRIKRAFRL